MKKSYIIDSFTNNSMYENHSIDKGKFFKTESKIIIFFSEFFSINVKSAIVWNWFIVKTILVSKEYLFWGYLNWQIEQRSIIKFLVADKCKQCQISKECEMYTEKHVLVKNIYKWAKHGFVTTSQSQKDHPWNGNTLTLW